MATRTTCIQHAQHERRHCRIRDLLHEYYRVRSDRSAVHNGRSLRSAPSSACSFKIEEM